MGGFVFDRKHHCSGKGQVHLSFLNIMSAHYFHCLTEIHQPKAAVLGHTDEMVSFPIQKKQKEL